MHSGFSCLLQFCPCVVCPPDWLILGEWEQNQKAVYVYDRNTISFTSSGWVRGIPQILAIYAGLCPWSLDVLGPYGDNPVWCRQCRWHNKVTMKNGKGKDTESGLALYNLEVSRFLDSQCSPTYPSSIRWRFNHQQEGAVAPKIGGESSTNSFNWLGFKHV